MNHVFEHSVRRFAYTWSVVWKKLVSCCIDGPYRELSQNGLEKKISAPAAPRTACSRPEAGRGLSGLRCRGLAACRTAHEDERVVWFLGV